MYSAKVIHCSINIKIGFEFIQDNQRTKRPSIAIMKSSIIEGTEIVDDIKPTTSFRITQEFRTVS